MQPDATGTDLKARGRYHHGDLKRALTDAALTLVAEKGPRGFTLTETARRAGVSSAAPYRHFADKDALLATVAAEGFRQLAAAVQDGVGVADDPTGGLVSMAVEYVRWAVAHPDHYRVMLGSGLEKSRYPDLHDAAEQAFDKLMATIVGCQESGLLAPGDPYRYAGPLWTSVHGIASLAVDDDLRQVGLTEPVDELARRATTDWLSAVRQR